MKTVSTKLLYRCILGALAVSAFAPTAFAQTFPNWVEPCGTAIGGADMGEKTRLIKATVALVPPGQLQPVVGSPGYYRLTAQSTFTSVFGGYPIVPGSQFYGEQKMSATNGRTGYLVAPDIIATASHGFFDQNSFAVIFDMRPQIPSGGTSCQPPNFDLIPESNIAFPPHNLLTSIPDGTPSGTADGRFDYAAFRLSTARTDRSFLRLRRSGDPRQSDHFAMTGHPERMAQKLTKDVEFVGMMTNSLGALGTTHVPRFRNHYFLDGSSGGPLYNLTTRFVETSVGSPNNLGCLHYSPSPALPGHYYFWRECSADIPGELPSKAVLNDGSIKELATRIPAAELLVSPISDTTQFVALGGTPPISSFTYDLRVHPGAPAAVNYSATLQAPAAGQPTLLSMTNSSGTLLIGATTSKTVNVSAAAVTKCGAYEQSVAFSDSTYGFTDTVKHRLEVGLTDFAIQAPASSRFQGVTTPYAPTQIQYTLSNPRPTASYVEATSTAPWLRIDGQTLPGSGPLIVGYNLSPQGSPGDSAVVTITLDTTAANALTAAEHSTDLTFSETNRCHNPASASSRTQAVVLDKRDTALAQEILTLVPEAATFNPLISTVNVPQTFCVSDIEVKASFASNSTFFGNSPFNSWKPDVDLYLTTPGGARAQIWDGTSAPGNWPYEPGPSTNLSTQAVRVNRSDRVPPGGLSLNLDTFINRQAAGTWTLEIADQSVNSLVGMADSWELKLKGTPGACPP